MTMIRRTLAVAAVALVAASSLQAQHSSDPDMKVNGGTLPAGWSARTDNPSSKIADARFVVMGPGFHVTSGPAAIYWRTGRVVSGPFKATATFTQEKAPTHPEAYGIFFAGNKLDAPDQTYFYFLVRGDGKVMLKHRAGTEVHTLIDWTNNEAVNKQDAAGKATNTLTVDASKPDSVRFLVNGKPVAARSNLGNIVGTVGLRVNHNLDVHIANYAVTPGR
jgi:hypothetical protein